MIKQFLFLIVYFLISISTVFSVEVTILQTTDIHSYLEYGDRRKSGGILRIATLIKNIRKKVGEEKTLLIDCGDTIQGTLTGYMTQGEVAITFINHLKYDAWVPGNHELDFGIKRFAELVQRCKRPILSANFTFPKQLKTPLLPYRIYKKNGAKIAVIGFQANFLSHWFYGKQFSGYRIKRSVPILEKILLEISSKKPDMIIVALHQGYLEKDYRGINEIAEIAKKIPQIDLILGGHTHREFAGKLLNKSYYVQAGKHADYLGVIKAEIDLDKSKVLKISSELIKADSSIKQDAELWKILKKTILKIRIFAKKIIAKSAKMISAKGLPGYDCEISEVICRALIKTTGADVALHGRFRKWNIYPGNITEQDLFNIIPYENDIAVAKVTKNDIKDIMNEQLLFKKSISFNGISGVICIQGKSGKIEKVLFPKKIKTERISLAFNSRVAADGGGRFPILKNIIMKPEAELQEVRINTRTALKKYLNSKDFQNFKLKSWIIKQDVKK